MTDSFTLQQTPEGFPFFGPGRGAPPSAGMPNGAPAAPPSPAASPAAAAPAKPTAAPDPWAAFPDAPPSAAPKATKADPWDAFPDKPPDRSADRQVGTAEAHGIGTLHGMTIGLAPALEGLSAASGIDEGIARPGGPAAPLRPIIGGAKMAYDWITGSDDPKIKEAYEAGRQHALEDERMASDQHPYAYHAGTFTGGMAVPLGGALRAGTIGARLLQGAIQGGVGGALLGAGEATSEGKSGGEVLKKAVVGAAVGAPLGGLVGGVAGPRLANPASAGNRAARTAEDLGAPLPRGVVSDSPAIQATTAKFRQLPFVGERIGHRVEETQRAAGNRIEAIANTMAGGATDRASADAVIRPALDATVTANRGLIDRAYNALRGQINLNQRFTLPRTDAALTAIMRDRRAAGHVDPAQGLEQFRNVAGGATFNGAHRARVDAREAGNARVPHPGYNAADYNRLTRAMTADLRELVQAAATNQTATGRRAALDAFDIAEREFGRLAEENANLQKLINSNGDGAIATLLNASKERGGNLPLLSQLRRSMPPQDFEAIGGVLLAELGHNAKTDAFSLAQFTTNLAKVSDGALRTLFSAQHLANIRDIAGMGQHIKGALKETSTSHSASMLVFFDIAKDIALLAHDVTAGAVGMSTLAGIPVTAGIYTLARWLGNPATAASMSAWSRAYRGITLNQPTPARVAVFKIATRNLANTLGVPVERLTQSILSHSGRAEPPEQQRENGLKK